MEENEVGSRQNIPVKTYGRLGKRIIITPKANATICNPGYKLELLKESVEVNIGIGNDHVAQLIMTVDAWKALKAGATISITTHKQFKKKFL